MTDGRKHFSPKLLRAQLNYVANKSKIFGPIIDELKLSLKTGGGWSKDWVAEMHGLAKAVDISYDIVETANLFFEWDPGE